MTERNKQILIAGLIFAFLLMGVVIYYYFMAVSPAIKRNSAQVVDLDKKIAEANKELSEIEALIADTETLAQLQEQVERAKRLLPENEEALEFLGILRESLRRTGVSQSNIRKLKAADRTLYREIPYLVSGEARYHEFGQFVNLIECNPERFMRVNTFTLRNNDSRPSIHPMEIGISTFMFVN